MVFCIVELGNSHTLNLWQDDKVVSPKRKSRRTSLGYKMVICFNVQVLLLWIKKSHHEPNTYNSGEASLHWAKAASSAALLSDRYIWKLKSAFKWIDFETKSTFVQELSCLAPTGWEYSEKPHLRVSKLPVGVDETYGVILSPKPLFMFLCHYLDRTTEHREYAGHDFCLINNDIWLHFLFPNEQRDKTFNSFCTTTKS